MLCVLRSIKPDIALGQHVFLNDVSQGVRCTLSLFGNAVQALGEGFHDPGHRRKEHANDERQLPVEVHQVAQQRQQRERVARQGHQRLHQKHCAGVHLVDHGVGQGAGRLVFKQ